MAMNKRNPIAAEWPKTIRIDKVLSNAPKTYVLPRPLSCVPVACI
jgi:hypothetical protein